MLQGAISRIASSQTL